MFLQVLTYPAPSLHNITLTVQSFSQVRREGHSVMEKGGVNHRDGSGFILSLILASNLDAAKSIPLCEATEPGKYVICKYIY